MVVEVVKVAVKASDGISVSTTLTIPHDFNDATSVIVISSATGVMQTFYAKFARYLAENGAVAITWDPRGIGASFSETVLKDPATTIERWALDLNDVLGFARDRFPRMRLNHIGHSVGGHMLPLAENAKYLHHTISVTAQNAFWLFAKDVPQAARNFFTWFVLVPTLTWYYGYLPSKKLGFFENLPNGVAKQWAYWCRHVDYMCVQKDILKKYNAFTRPVLAYSFSDDAYCADHLQIVALHSHMAKLGENVTYRHMTPKMLNAKRVGHMGFFKEAFKETLWREAATYLIDGIMPEPLPEPLTASKQTPTEQQPDEALRARL